MSTTSLTSLLALVPGLANSRVEYVVGGQNLAPAAREQAAQILADEAMMIRCGAPSKSLTRWRAVRDGKDPGSLGSAKAVEQYAAVGFGWRKKPANADHLQGLVAELVWNRLIRERTTGSGGRTLVKAHSVKPDPTEPGGDGLVVYRVGDVFVFRLWEIKKHEQASHPVSSTISRATTQLVTRGGEYLAKLCGPDTVEQRGELGEFYADVVELWLDDSDRAGVGVPVGTSDVYAPTQSSAFASIASKFPKFGAAGQTEGVVVAVPDFPAFALRVREIVWSGL